MSESASATHDGDAGRIDMVSNSIVTREKVRAGLQQDLESVDALRSLDHDWDSYGAPPIDPGAIEAAKQLLRLSAERAPTDTGFPARPYAIAPLASGGVQLAWRAQHAELEVAVRPNGRASILLIHYPGEEETHVEDNDATIQRVLTYFAANE